MSLDTNMSLDNTQDVCLSVQTGSDLPAVRMTRLTHLRHGPSV
jgi:hypothetical protein